MKPLSERDENEELHYLSLLHGSHVGMKPLSERDENFGNHFFCTLFISIVGMKPLSERDENLELLTRTIFPDGGSRNEATL